MNGDCLLYYYDARNAYQLTFADDEFILSRSKAIPVNREEWNSLHFEPYKRFRTLDEFWNDLITDKKWFKTYSYLNRNGLASKPFVLAKPIISFFNELRKNQAFTYKDYDKINHWSQPVWSEAYRQNELKQWCPHCGSEVHYQPRYPKYICVECAAKDMHDRNGNRVEFSNVGFSGGLRITYTASDGKVIREDDSQFSCECIIDDKVYIAQEARFGGIVIQPKEALEY